MSARPTGAQLDRVLEVVIDWQAQAKARNLAFYSNAIIRNELTVKQGKEFTSRECKCSICYMKQELGIRQYWYHEDHEYELHCEWLRPCAGCWQELTESVSVQALNIAQTLTVLVDSSPTT